METTERNLRGLSNSSMKRSFGFARIAELRLVPNWHARLLPKRSYWVRLESMIKRPSTSEENWLSPILRTVPCLHGH